MLRIFEGSKFADTDLVKNFNTEFIEEFIHQENRCLKMPGSPCFSNLDCAVNEKITNITQIINTTTEDSLDGQNNLNRYEAVFWQNTLICGQRFPKDNKEYELKNNRCCRDHDKHF